MSNLHLSHAHSPAFVDAEHTAILIRVEFVELASFGELPFLALADDVEAHGRDIHTRALAGEFGEVAAYVPPAD